MINIWNFIISGSLGLSIYLTPQLISKLIKQVNKCKASVMLFSKLRKEYGNNLIKANALDCLYLNHGKYALLSGMAKKLVKRLPNEIINEKIILSKGNSFYIETFKLAKIPQNLLECKSIIIEPSLQTKMLDVFERWNNGKLMKKKSFIRRLFKSKSEVIKDGDGVYLFGTVKELSPSTISIHPYYISNESFNDIEYESSSIVPIIKSGFMIITNVIAIAMITKLIYDYYQQWKRNRKVRCGIYCSKCKNNLCNVLCEKCENVTNYCSDCYKRFQVDINNNKIKLKDIKCIHCNLTLNSVQELTLAN